MNQFSWTYCSPKGKNFRIGLYHGHKGHLVVHCNGGIVLVDFNVLATRNYKFYIEEELCELTLEREGASFRYGLTIDKETPTPMNLARKQVARQDSRKTMLFFGGMVLLIAVGVWTITSFAKPAKIDHQAVWMRQTVATTGVVTLSDTLEGQQAVRIAYTADGQELKGLRFVDYRKPLLLHNGIPLASGDEFQLRYWPDDPTRFTLLWDQPTPAQLERWQRRAMVAHAALHPEWTEQQVSCRVMAAVEQNGIAGLANIFAQEADPVIHPEYNRQTYQRMVRDVPYRQYVTQHCL